ncbi:MAG TPA: CvpA family protein, partial [Caldisericia bacterium]|nr:CvpA family protein [Caldisericia bacterium]
LTLFLESRMNFVTNIKNYIANHINLPPETKILPSTIENLKLYISNLTLPSFFKSWLTENLPFLSSFDNLITVYDSYLYLLSVVIGEIISFFILFLIFMIIFSILKKLLGGIIHKIPILGTLDRLLGLIFNLLLYFSIIVFCVFILSNLFLNYLTPNSNFYKFFNSSFFVGFIQENMVLFKSLLNLIIRKAMEVFI